MPQKLKTVSEPPPPEEHLFRAPAPKNNHWCWRKRYFDVGDLVTFSPARLVGFGRTVYKARIVKILVFSYGRVSYRVQFANPVQRKLSGGTVECSQLTVDLETLIPTTARCEAYDESHQQGDENGFFTNSGVKRGTTTNRRR